MKQFVTILMLAMSLLPCRADIVDEADMAYGADDFSSAVALYKKAIEQLGPSSDRYYNLGNAYYRADSLGLAIVCYERALRLDPGNKDIKENLEFANSKTTDRLQLTKSFVNNTADKLAGTMHPNSLAWTALAIFILALAGVATYFFATNVTLRKVCFFGSGILMIVCIIVNILAYRSAKNLTRSDQAIVVSHSVLLSTTPRTPKDRSEEAMLLHEGTKVTLIDSISSGNSGSEKWYDVRVDDNNRAWIPARSIVII